MGWDEDALPTVCSPSHAPPPAPRITHIPQDEGAAHSVPEQQQDLPHDDEPKRFVLGLCRRRERAAHVAKHKDEDGEPVEPGGVGGGGGGVGGGEPPDDRVCVPQ